MTEADLGQRDAAAGPHVTLHTGLPGPLPVGRATAIFCAGTYSAHAGAVRDLELVVDGRHHPTFRSVAASEAQGGAYWATIPIPARRQPGPVALRACVHLADGAARVISLGQIDYVARPAPPSRPGLDGGAIAICMATYDPDPALFAAQIASLRAQTDPRWICVISDDCSAPERFAQIQSAVAGDARFSLSRAPRRLGFYGNFERALGLAPAEAELLALCDQDDRWHPDKLALLRATLGDAGMVYSDLRLVDARGGLLRDTLWKGRRRNHSDLASLLIANSVVGASMLLRREVADLALPFPRAPGVQFHDHWLALVALASGDIAYVDRPLYDYVQHAGAVFGAVSSRRAAPGRTRRLDRWRAAYFCGHVPREVQALTLLQRCSDTLSVTQRRSLARYVASARSPIAFVWLAVRPLRRVGGHDETLGGESALAAGILWCWLAVRRRRPLAGRWSANTSVGDPAGFEQRRLRRWRAGMGASPGPR